MNNSIPLSAVVCLLASSVASVSAASYKDVVLGDAPFAYYRLNESTNASPAADQKLNNPGSYKNTPACGISGAISSDATNTAVLFTRADSQYVQLTTLGNFGSTSTSGFTVEYWLKTADSTDYQGILGTINSPGSNTALLADIGYSGDAGRLRLYYRDENNNRYETNFLPTGGNIDIYNNKWHYIVQVYDPGATTVGDRVLFYVDGVRQTATPLLGGGYLHQQLTSVTR